MRLLGRENVEVMNHQRLYVASDAETISFLSPRLRDAYDKEITWPKKESVWFTDKSRTMIYIYITNAMSAHCFQSSYILQNILDDLWF